MPANSFIYSVAYRPIQSGVGGRIDAWPTALEVGKILPKVPLSLGAELCLPLDLEISYAEACERRKMAEVLR